MQLYDCTVRLGGSMMNEVAMEATTAAQIMVLRSIHGEDAVVRIAAKKMDKRSHREERARLNGLYGTKRVDDLFGNPIAAPRLPVKLDGFDPSSDPDEYPEDEGDGNTPPANQE